MDVPSYPAAFLAAIEVVLGHEGGYSAVESDPGNWTGGAVGIGQLKGTKWGISAASFPTLDIVNLSRDQAVATYFALYWRQSGCPLLPAPAALLVLDAAVNNGVGRAVRWLQAAVGAKPDGLLGTASAAAIASVLATSNGLDRLGAEFMAQRTLFMTGLAAWRDFGGGWARRLTRLPFQANRLPLAA